MNKNLENFRPLDYTDYMEWQYLRMSINIRWFSKCGAITGILSVLKICSKMCYQFNKHDFVVSSPKDLKSTMYAKQPLFIYLYVTHLFCQMKCNLFFLKFLKLTKQSFKKMLIFYLHRSLLCWPSVSWNMHSSPIKHNVYMKIVQLGIIIVFVFFKFLLYDLFRVVWFYYFFLNSV
jgi:hypothetical protein